MKIYFAASITGGRTDAPIYAKILRLLQGYGEVVDPQVGDPTLSAMGETGKTDFEVCEAGFHRIAMAEVVVAEVTNPSTGVGMEVQFSVDHGKAVLCVYRDLPGRRTTRMVTGNSRFASAKYADAEGLTDLRAVFDDFFDELGRKNAIRRRESSSQLRLTLAD